MPVRIQSQRTMLETDPLAGIEVTTELIAKLADTDRAACYLVRDVGEDRAGEFFIPRGTPMLLNKPVLEPWRFTFLTRAGGIFSIEATVLLDRTKSVHPVSLAALNFETSEAHEEIHQRLVQSFVKMATAIDDVALAFQAKIDQLYAERTGTINANLSRLGAPAESRVIRGYTSSERIKEMQND